MNIKYIKNIFNTFAHVLPPIGFKASFISFEGKTLLWEPDDLALDLIEQGASKDQYVLRQYLDAENSLDLNLTQKCIKHFKRQFMQIKSTTNILFSHTHTT